MTTITVLTPVHEGGYAHLPELYECLAGQRLPAGWRLEWAVQEDGRTGKPLDALPDAPWIGKGAGRWGGAAQARTLGLARASGALLRCVDADDPRTTPAPGRCRSGRSWTVPSAVNCR